MRFVSTNNRRFITEVYSTRRIRLAICFAFLLSSILIIAAAQGDLWFDEIRSLLFARASHSVTELFVHFRHDNNHLLNTLFLYCLGERKTLFAYRLLAVFSGICSVFLIGYIGRRNWGYPEALCSIVFTGTSYPLLLYFSEARGYSPAILFALLSYIALRRNSQDFRLGRLVFFWAASILGMLSHLTFFMVTMSFFVGSVAHEICVGGSLRRKTLRLMVHHVPPFAFFAWLYIFFVRGMLIGGGPIYEKWDVISRASALLLGFPEVPVFLGSAVVAVVVLVALGANSLRQEHDTQWLFFPSLLLFSPALLLIVINPEYLYFRYFIVCYPFFYLLLSYLTCKWYRACPIRWRWLLIVAVAMLIAGQTLRVYPLLKLGRGSYAAALTRISESSAGGIVRVGGDQDFRNRVLFDFYGPLIRGKNILVYVEQRSWLLKPPDWILTQSQDLSYQPPKELAVANVGRYSLTDEYRFSGISGWNWFLFRRETLNDGDKGGRR
jgi:hypothetical protein